MFFGCQSHVKNVLETFFEFIVAVFTVIIISASIYRTYKPQISKIKGVTVKKSKISRWLVSPAQRALKIFLPTKNIV
jgi:hypothetical protein